MIRRRMKILIFALAGLALATTSYAGSGQRYDVQKNGAIVYSAPRTTAPVVMRLNRGDRVIEWRRQGLWVKISRLGAVGKTGWVKISRLQTEASEIRIKASPNGQFFVRAIVNGMAVNFLVDTGATIVALRPEDAKRLGFRETGLQFNLRVQTAGGEVRAAPVVLAEIKIGELTIRNVTASVHKKSLNISLLGMSFLGRLRGYEVRGKQLVLRW